MLQFVQVVAVVGSIPYRGGYIPQTSGDKESLFGKKHVPVTESTRVLCMPNASHFSSLYFIP